MITTITAPEKLPDGGEPGMVTFTSPGGRTLVLHKGVSLKMAPGAFIEANGMRVENIFPAGKPEMYHMQITDLGGANL